MAVAPHLGQRLRDADGRTFRVEATHHAPPSYEGSMGNPAFPRKRVRLLNEASGVKWTVRRSPWPPRGYEVIGD